MKKIPAFSLFLFALFIAPLAFAAPEPQPGQPVQDLPQKIVDRSTAVNVLLEGSDAIGSRLATRLRERFNQSGLFKLNSQDEKAEPELRLLINTAPEFPSRPNFGSIYGVCWVFSQGKGYLPYLLAREVGVVNADDIDALIDKLVERTDGIAAKYSNLWK